MKKEVKKITIEYLKMGTSVEPFVVVDYEGEQLRFWVLLPKQKEKLNKLLEEIANI